MYSIIYTIGMVGLWFINLLNGTGIGAAYRTTELATMAAVVVALGCVAYHALRDGEVYVPSRYFYVLFPMTLVFVGVSLMTGRRLAGLEGFWVYLLVYILSMTRPDIKALRMTAIAYAILGLVILYIYNYMDVLDGWNANSIAMIGLFSFLVFTIPFYGMRDWRSFVTMPFIGAAYVFLIWPTDSRSCIVVVIIALLLVLRIIRTEKAMASSAGLTLVLLVPLFVAVFICLFSLFGDTSGLTQWSLETFEKDLFNGRDKIWIDGFQRLLQHPWFGNGEISAGYWHNCAMSCLTAFGIIGYALWLRLFYVILREGKPFLGDTCVAGSMVAFLIIFCHQSVELGIFATNPSLLPYLILGILLGRVNYLRRKQGCLQ